MDDRAERISDRSDDGHAEGRILGTRPASWRSNRGASDRGSAGASARHRVGDGDRSDWPSRPTICRSRLRIGTVLRHGRSAHVIVEVGPDRAIPCPRSKLRVSIQMPLDHHQGSGVTASGGGPSRADVRAEAQCAWSRAPQRDGPAALRPGGHGTMLGGLRGERQAGLRKGPCPSLSNERGGRADRGRDTARMCRADRRSKLRTDRSDWRTAPAGI
jgi:hypothetical protein